MASASSPWNARGRRVDPRRRPFGRPFSSAFVPVGPVDPRARGKSLARRCRGHDAQRRRVRPCHRHGDPPRGGLGLRGGRGLPAPARHRRAHPALDARLHRSRHERRLDPRRRGTRRRLRSDPLAEVALRGCSRRRASRVPRSTIRRSSSGSRTARRRSRPKSAACCALFPPGVSRATLGAAVDRVRFQRGHAERFRDGLVRAGQWEPHIRRVFRDAGLPQELVSLPHVESSFNPAAYSKVGAAGLWQFMPGTGKRFLRIDRVVDERYDPWRSSEAAAALLRENYRITGAWPLAVTAYNHGAGGMMRAVKQLGTKDISVIIDRYQSETFGFASRNFYTEFLAAHDVETAGGATLRSDLARAGGQSRDRRHSSSHLGDGAVAHLRRRPGAAARTQHGSARQRLGRTHRGAGRLRGAAAEGRRAPARGAARGVAAAQRSSQRAQRQPARLSEPPSRPPRRHPHESREAVRGFGECAREDERPAHVQPPAGRSDACGFPALRRRAGRSPPQSPASKTTVARAATTKAGASEDSTTQPRRRRRPAKAKPAVRSHTVKQGETLTAIARKSGVSVKQLAAANGISASHRVRAGQRLRIPD